LVSAPSLRGGSRSKYGGLMPPEMKRLKVLEEENGGIDFSRTGKPTDNAFAEAFNGRVRAKCLNAFCS
jgi:hypothetical protein